MPSATVDNSDTQDSLLLKIDPPKVLDIIMAKQAQLYGLWAVYTAVEFTAGSFGMGKLVPLGVAIAVWLGVWAFNIGHLGFVLQCIAQLKALRHVLKVAEKNDRVPYEDALKVVMNEMQESESVLRYYFRKGPTWSYFSNSSVHLFIDACASAALLIRVGNPWIQVHIPEILRMAVS